ncbi:hypothetical protein SAMN05443575_2727 [Jatrophihabitans endophyticus]|uniref:Uncharacterized protein n=1 Tax=Jatrophihabitans endophyticus TaxID=1206085 RepID=A0A1M5MGX3_9ACTN|nr:hypothetical protein [Jatrophihabitans endophyticus]SHG76654.1 hypothetical protein SAMN05443575_2727 [Jatrophihabitans endophyticus]
MGESVERDGRRWPLGDSGTVAWIDGATPAGVSISAAVPLRYEAYATSSTPAVDDGSEPTGDPDAVLVRYAETLIAILARGSAPQPWWLGYLDTGAHDVVFPDAPRTTLYNGWPYVLVQAGPREALTWRAPDHWKGPLPDLLFPADRSWLVSQLWDDDWRCVGASRALVAALLAAPLLAAREVQPDEDATPPGFTAS